MDLLNTKLVQNGESLDLLGDAERLRRWLVAAGIVSGPVAKAAFRRWEGSRALRSLLRELLVFREALREAVVRFEAGEAPDPRFLAGLNRKLYAFPIRHGLALRKGRVELEVLFEPAGPDDLWSPVAASAAALFTEVPASKVRRCESCAIHFQDVSKKGSRRWCSMHLCGNREKVAAYRERQRNSA